VVCDGLTITITAYFFMQIGVSFKYRGESGFLTRIVGEFMFPPVYGLWLYSFTQAPQCISYRVFCWKPFKLLGEWSFALYCLHFPSFAYYRWIRFAGKYGWGVGDSKKAIEGAQLQPFDFPIFFGLLISLSALVFYKVEQPCRKGLYTRLGRLFGLRSTSAYGTLEDSAIEMASLGMDPVGHLDGQDDDAGSETPVEASEVPAPVPVVAQLTEAPVVTSGNPALPVAVPVGNPQYI
jgi:peptidoglycan/LPS O-acetylase OafA/YrhL